MFIENIYGNKSGDILSKKKIRRSTAEKHELLTDPRNSYLRHDNPRNWSHSN